ncbi:hypothetical protein [Aquimarina sediminis]|uniref:hypothetical protein n=1 Tax=Aquimarina sediminis TaxID=2070536 RepID=UPI000CA053DA|nr:hypothetical protein [Aquimarina sediminis]
MKNTTSISAIILITISFFSCSKDNEEVLQGNPNSTKSTQEIIASDSFNEIGLKHNEELRYILQNLPKDISKDNVLEKTIKVLSKKYPVENLQKLDWYTDYNNASKMFQELYDKGLMSYDLYEVGLRDFRDLDNFENYGSIDDFIISRLELTHHLSSKDDQKYKNFLSVLKHSFRFWDPNGENGASYLHLSKSHSKHLYDDLRKIVGIAAADSVSNFVTIDGQKIPTSTFDAVQSFFYHVDAYFL